MNKLSFRPSPAMVVACVSLFVALGGTATAVTYVVSSNSQIRPGTVSGHNPPSGKHANIIGGSINQQDLAQQGVTRGKLAPQSVNSAKVANGSLVAGDTDTSSIQHRVGGSCPSGQAARSVGQNGNLSCGVTNGGTPGGTAGGDLTGSFPNPTIGSGKVGLSQLAGADGFSSSSQEGVPFVIHDFVQSGLMSGTSTADFFIYNANAPRGFQILDAWVTGFNAPDITWQLRSASGGGGQAITDPQTGPASNTVEKISGNLQWPSSRIFAGDTMVVHFSKSSPGNSGTTFELYMLAVPVT
jgi:hypothetical protein